MTNTSKRQELAELLDTIAQQITYDAGRSGRLSVQQLRATAINDKIRGGLTAAGARAAVPDTVLENVLPFFRDLLSSFVDKKTDRIGDGLVNLAGGIPQPTLSEYIQILVRAAAILGGQRIADLLIGWINGEPIRYQTKCLLSGVTIERPLSLPEGLQLSQLPKSSNELAAHLPPVSLETHGIHSLLGGVALSIECEAHPALYPPTNDDGASLKANRLWANGQIEGFTLDSFCESMSLACGGSVRWQLSWNDFGDVREFCSVYGGMSFTNVPRWGSATPFTQETLELSRDIHRLRIAIGKTKPGLDTASRRWIKSKASESSFADQFIDLRIALEALYLDNPEGEFRFRLAAHGAWHISDTTEERKQNYRTLLQAYNVASAAVHGREVMSNDKNKKLLQDAQKLCLNGILKRLKEKSVPEWNNLIMGED